MIHFQIALKQIEELKKETAISTDDLVNVPLQEVRTMVTHQYSVQLFRCFISSQNGSFLHTHDTYGAWREGVHDDLVLATALACWYAERIGGRRMSIGSAPKKSLWREEDSSLPSWRFLGY